MDVKSTVHFFFHGIVGIMYFCALIRYEFLPPMPHTKSHEQYAGRFKYLTYWNLISQFIFFASSCLMDLMKNSSGRYHRMVKLKDKVYAGIVLPYGVFVVGMFWILYGIDRELIFPHVLDGIFPSWLNHVSHTVILPVLLMETYLVKHRHPKIKDGMMLTAAFGCAYLMWILYLGLAMDIWVYPVLRIINWPQRFLFFLISVFIVYFMYTTGELINSYFWGQQVRPKYK